MSKVRLIKEAIDYCFFFQTESGGLIRGNQPFFQVWRCKTYMTKKLGLPTVLLCLIFSFP